MGIGVSLLLVAAGAILIWAVNATVSGIELQTIGWILLAVGAIGALLSLIFWSSWGGVGGPADGRGRRTVVRDDYYTPDDNLIDSEPRFGGALVVTAFLVVPAASR
jgi:Domain of unknown function (DUF6458)